MLCISRFSSESVTGVISQHQTSLVSCSSLPLFGRRWPQISKVFITPQAVIVSRDILTFVSSSPKLFLIFSWLLIPSPIFCAASFHPHWFIDDARMSIPFPYTLQLDGVIEYSVYTTQGNMRPDNRFARVLVCCEVYLMIMVSFVVPC